MPNADTNAPINAPQNARAHWRTRGSLWLLLVVAVSAGSALARTEAPATRPNLSPADLGIVYSLETRNEPRPLRIHHLRVDLTNPRTEVVSVLAADPDGDGPANATLTLPHDLARQAQAVAFINCNPWQGVPDALGKRPTNWVPGLPVQVAGLAAEPENVRSKPGDPAHCSIWSDTAGKLHIGRPPQQAAVQYGVAGFAQLLDAGRELPFTSPILHPRTALGLDATGQTLHLVVVDGRQAEYSEGMTYAELAGYMRQAGCSTAVNLDGGGSSIMLLATEPGEYRVLNRPSTRVAGVSLPRPIPVGLAVRARMVPARAKP